MSDTKITNPKPDDQKHYAITSEYSKPHTSSAEPEEHVDSMAFGEGGRRAPEHDVDHITFAYYGYIFFQFSYHRGIRKNTSAYFYAAIASSCFEGRSLGSL